MIKVLRKLLGMKAPQSSDMHKSEEVREEVRKYDLEVEGGNATVTAQGERILRVEMHAEAGQDLELRCYNGGNYAALFCATGLNDQPKHAVNEISKACFDVLVLHNRINGKTANAGINDRTVNPDGMTVS